MSLFLSLLFAGAVPGLAVAATQNVPVLLALHEDGRATVTIRHLQTVVRQEQVMIRIPAARSMVNFSTTRQTDVVRPPRPLVWREKKAPRCIPMGYIMGVQFVQKDSIDLLTRERMRLRASLNDNCRAADFYSGFYIRPPKDGKLCADRDILHARSGTKCEVDRFTVLVPEFKE